MTDVDPWQPHYHRPLVEVVDSLWRAAADAYIVDHHRLRRWRELWTARGGRLACPPDNASLRLLTGPAWWDSFDARTVTAVQVGEDVDPLRRFLGTPDPRVRQPLQAVAAEIDRLRPSVFLHAVMTLLLAVADQRVLVSGIPGFAGNPDGLRSELPQELTRHRLWRLHRDGSITVQHTAGALELRYILAELSPIESSLSAQELISVNDVMQASPIRTGMAGRPSSLHLVRMELGRRAAAGHMKPILKDEMVELSEWLGRHHPDCPQAKPKALENSLRSEYRDLRNVHGSDAS
jgi:hypothetical protein